ncbi:hypothetical protein [Virgibacillus salexigens]|nr:MULTISPECIES: hypothetical protein [Virgibacillus]MYL43120.1 hypothetical protein [Virgibacillus massiliensis]
MGADNQEDLPTIAAAEGLNYETTFEDLNLGHLFHFDFTLPQADQREVSL